MTCSVFNIVKLLSGQFPLVGQGYFFLFENHLFVPFFISQKLIPLKNFNRWQFFLDVFLSSR